VDRATLSNWDNGEDRVGRQSDLLIRSVALGLGSGLRDKLESLIRHFEHIKKAQKRTKVSVDAETLEYEYA
jgi:hypothetical protein